MNISENDDVPRKELTFGNILYSGGPLSFDFPKSNYKATCYVTLFYCWVERVEFFLTEFVIFK